MTWDLKNYKRKKSGVFLKNLAAALALFAISLYLTMCFAEAIDRQMQNEQQHRTGFQIGGRG